VLDEDKISVSRFDQFLEAKFGERNGHCTGRPRGGIQELHENRLNVATEFSSGGIGGDRYTEPAERAIPGVLLHFNLLLE